MTDRVFRTEVLKEDDVISKTVSSRNGETNSAQRSQETFWQMIDAAPFGVYAVDSDFRIARISRGAASAFAGIEPVIGRNLAEVLRIIWPEPFATEAIDHFRHTLKTGEEYRAPPVVEKRADRDGVEAYDWGLDRVILDDGRPGVVCHFYDLTERVAFERALEERERLLNLAYNVAEMGAWEVDLVTLESQWSPQLYRLFGADASSDESIAEIVQRTVHSDDYDKMLHSFAAARTSGEAMEFDFRIRTAEGKVRHLMTRGEVLHDVDGRPARMIGMNLDITVRKTAEQAMHNREQLLRDVVDNTVGFVGVLSQDGTLREANETALKAGGLRREDVIGKFFWDTWWWSYDPDVVERLKDACARAASGQTVRYDERVRMALDSRMDIDFQLVPVLEDDGTPKMLVASGLDITAREQAQEQVRSLLGEVSHRTKNILTLVQILARHSARSGSEDFIKQFEARLKALAEAQDLLVQSDGDAVDLRELTVTQLGHFRELIGSRIQIDGRQISLSSKPAQILGMALHELATNASKYGALSTEEGMINLAWGLEGIGEDAHFEISWIEREGPPVRKPELQGFGSTVLYQMARSALDAEVELEHETDGLRWFLRCRKSNLAK